MEPFQRREEFTRSPVDGKLPDVDYVNNKMRNIETIDSGLADFLVIFMKKENKSDEFGMRLKENVLQIGHDLIVEVIVEKVIANSAAKHANIECGDQIVQINSELVTSKQNAEHLLARVNKAAYINIIRLHEMYKNPYHKDRKILKPFCYPFPSASNSHKCTDQNGSCSDQPSTRLCHVIIEQLKKRLSVNEDNHSDDQKTMSNDNIEITSQEDCENRSSDSSNVNTSETMEECLLMYTSPRHLAKTMRIQQEIYKRLILAKKTGKVFKENSENLIREPNGVRNPIDFPTNSNSSKWVIRKRFDGSRYVTKRINEKNETHRKDASKFNRRNVSCQLPIKSDCSKLLNSINKLGSSRDQNSLLNNEENILSVMIL